MAAELTAPAGVPDAARNIIESRESCLASVERMALSRGVVWTLAAAAIAVCLGGAVASAQQDDRRTTTVQDRPRPDYDPVGTRLGGFLILPNISISETFDDNIFAVDNGAISDFITNIEPAIVVKSNWNRHSLRITGTADFGLYADRNDENYEDYSIRADARVDALRDTYLTGDLRFSKLHEDRGSPDDVNGLEPGEFELLEPAIGIFNRWNRASLSVRGSLLKFDFDDVPTLGGTINNDDRDRSRYDLVIRGGYEIVPEYEGFVRLNLSTTDYDDAVDDSGVNRDSDGIEAVVGTRIDLSGVTFGDVFIGYVQHEYDDSALAKINSLTFGADVTWNMTRLTTLNAGVTRSVQETTQGASPGSLLTKFDFSADHELLRSLILSARAAYELDDFKEIAREDKYLRLGFGGKYLVNRNLHVSLQYDFSRRDSNVANQDYTSNIVMLRLRGQI